MPTTIGPIAPVRPVRSQYGSPPERQAPEQGGAAPDASVKIEASALAAAPPVDTDRVAAIRAALADGSYPLVPTRIADAMIAAGLRLSLGE